MSHKHARATLRAQFCSTVAPARRGCCSALGTPLPAVVPFPQRRAEEAASVCFCRHRDVRLDGYGTRNPRSGAGWKLAVTCRFAEVWLQSSKVFNWLFNLSRIGLCRRYLKV
jgi:hypothetical protein